MGWYAALGLKRGGLLTAGESFLDEATGGVGGAGETACGDVVMPLPLRIVKRWYTLFDDRRSWTAMAGKVKPAARILTRSASSWAV